MRGSCERPHSRAPLNALQSRSADDADEDEGDGASYQLEMMRCLREVNVDNNTVGWCAHLA